MHPCVLPRACLTDARFFTGTTCHCRCVCVKKPLLTRLCLSVRWLLPAGLLSTEAGTFGRFTGNAALTLVGRATGVSDLPSIASFAKILHGMLAASCALLLVQLGATFSRLEG